MLCSMWDQGNWYVYPEYMKEIGMCTRNICVPGIYANRTVARHKRSFLRARIFGIDGLVDNTVQGHPGRPRARHRQRDP